MGYVAAFFLGCLLGSLATAFIVGASIENRDDE